MIARSFLAPASGSGGDGTFRPQLTSLIDVMTILLVFLIKSFSVEGNLVTPSHDLALPLSRSQTPARPILSIEVTRDAVVAEGAVLARHEESSAAGGLRIAPLEAWLRAKRAAAADSALMREVLVQCDRDVPFSVVKRVLFTAGRAGFTEYTVLVVREES